ncbi:hypothetical protein CDAR_218931 [Caerostris darwini]|uniref:Uncharacterized protein n=1 Tax=Caerostris darwini TaxID=1538125 RepID=A0AAV4VPA6_9ARAC|nr:hypothetical protein CDAR_218931 [Caerostris darwini]
MRKISRSPLPTHLTPRFDTLESGLLHFGSAQSGYTQMEEVCLTIGVDGQSSRLSNFTLTILRLAALRGTITCVYGIHSILIGIGENHTQ